MEIEQEGRTNRLPCLLLLTEIWSKRNVGEMFLVFALKFCPWVGMTRVLLPHVVVNGNVMEACAPFPGGRGAMGCGGHVARVKHGLVGNGNLSYE